MGASVSSDVENCIIKVQALARGQMTRAKFSMAQKLGLDLTPNPPKNTTGTPTGYRIIIEMNQIRYTAWGVRHLRFYKDADFNEPLTQEEWTPMSSGFQRGYPPASAVIADSPGDYWMGTGVGMSSSNCGKMKEKDCFYLGLSCKTKDGAEVKAISYAPRDDDLGYKPRDTWIYVEKYIRGAWYPMGKFDGTRNGTQTLLLQSEGIFTESKIADFSSLQSANIDEVSTIVEEVTKGMEFITLENGIKLYKEDPAPGINERLAKRNVQFVDPEFNVERKATFQGEVVKAAFVITDENFKKNQRKRENFVQFANESFWVRASHWNELKGSPIIRMNVFDGSGTSDDIMQGKVGNCWMCSRFSSFAAHRRDLLPTLISPNVLSANGCYSIRLFSKGEPLYLLLDDYLLYRDWGGVTRPLSVRSRNPEEIWPMLLEKAFAKMAGSYRALQACVNVNINYSKLGDVLSIVSGISDYESIDFKSGGFKNGKELVDRIKRDEKGGCIAVANVPLGMDKKGLVENHSYSLIWCGTIEDKSLFYLRNPWGSKEWYGDWSDKWPLWVKHKSIVDKLVGTGLFEKNDDLCAPAFKVPDHKAHTNDGAFFIEYNDLIKYFEDITVFYFPGK